MFRHSTILGDLQGAFSIVGMIIMWNGGIKAAKAIFTNLCKFCTGYSVVGVRC